MNAPSAEAVGAPALDAELLYRELRGGVAPMLTAATHLVGIVSGGGWLVQRLHDDLRREGRPGAISSAMHRDDFARRGLANASQTTLPFEVDGADILLVDDVLYTGRTIRAVLNELFDYGRPSRVRLAVLVDRGGRQLPVAADLAVAQVLLPAARSLELARADDGCLTFRIDEVTSC